MDEDFFNNLNSFINNLFAESKEKKDQFQEKDPAILLKQQLGHNNYVLETHRDLDAITYVTTLELIKEVLMDMQDKHKDKILHNNPYELILSEIEPALDDLTLDSLMLVVEQYKRISEINEGKVLSFEHKKIGKEIRNRHKEFQKVIKRG